VIALIWRPADQGGGDMPAAEIGGQVDEVDGASPKTLIDGEITMNAF